MTLTLQEISDRIEIDDLVNRVAVATDTWDWDLMDTCYVPESVLDFTCASGPRTTYPEFLEWLKSSQEHHTLLMERKVTTRLITLDGDTATGRVFCVKFMKRVDRDNGTDAGALTLVGHQYNDRYGRTPAGWKIMERVEEITWYDGTWPPDYPVHLSPLPWDRIASSA